MTPEEAVARIVERSHATLIGRAYDMSQEESKLEFAKWMTAWYNAIQKEIKRGGRVDL